MKKKEYLRSPRNGRKDDFMMLVIETKVSAIATQKQIDKYKEAIEKECKEYEIYEWGLILLDICDERFNSGQDVEEKTDEHFKIIDGREIRKIFKGSKTKSRKINDKRIIEEYRKWLKEGEDVERWLENRCRKVLIECASKDKIKHEDRRLLSEEEPKFHRGWGWRVKPKEDKVVGEIALRYDIEGKKVNLEFWFANTKEQARPFYRGRIEDWNFKKLLKNQTWEARANVFFNFRRYGRFRLNQGQIKSYKAVNSYFKYWKKEIRGNGSVTKKTTDWSEEVKYFKNLEMEGRIKSVDYKDLENIEKYVNKAQEYKKKEIHIVPSLGMLYKYSYDYFLEKDDKEIAEDVLKQISEVLKYNSSIT